MRRVAFLLVPLLFAAVRVSAQTVGQADEACDPGEPFACAVSDQDTGRASVWRDAAPAAGVAVAAAWLALSMPGVFASHSTAAEPWSPQARGSDLNGSAGATGNPELRAGGPVGENGAVPGRGSPYTPAGPPPPEAPSAEAPSAVAAVAPEPASLALLATGLAGLMVVGLQRRRRVIRLD